MAVVDEITFVAAEITFEVAVITSSVAKVTFVAAENKCGYCWSCGNPHLAVRLTVWAGSGVSNLRWKAVARPASISNRAASSDAHHLLPGCRVERTSR